MAESSETSPRPYAYGLRKRRRATNEQDSKNDGIQRLLNAADAADKILIFSGSGLSATSGMSTFSTKGGLYERAQREFKLQDGKILFTYTFYEKNKSAALAFFADIYQEACQAEAAPGHYALADIHQSGRLCRHYTLNIDGLANKVGMDTWHPRSNPDGSTVEMHGNVHQLICTECGESVPVNDQFVRDFKNKKSILCQRCPNSLRFKVMLYEDAESDVITPEEVMDLMEEDSKAADLILWVGISFQQSASTAYFRKVRHWLQEAGKLEETVQAVINPSDEALWNLLTACSNQSELNVIEILAPADEVLPALARHMIDH